MVNAILIALTMAVFLGLFQITSVTDGLDRVLWEERFNASYRPVSEEIVVVDIDARSLDKLGVWPLPRKSYADLIDKLVAAGTVDIVFDIDFSASSNPYDDLLFAQALERAGTVSLAAFRQAATQDQNGDGEILNLPSDQFLDFAWPVVVMVPVEPDSRIWRSLYGYPLDGTDELSAAAYLAGYSGEPRGAFWMDYSIAIDELQTVSLIDVLEGDVSPDIFKDRKVIVGASAQELRDLFPVPVHDILPGSVIQVLGAETLLQDRSLKIAGKWPAVLAVFCIYLMFMMTRVEGLTVKFVILGLSALALEAAAYIILQRTPILVATASAQLFLAMAALVIIFRELGFHKLISHLSQIRERNSERMLGQVFDDSFDAILVIDRNGKINAASQTARSLFGAEKMIGVAARDVLPPELVLEAINALASATDVRPVPKTLTLESGHAERQFIEYVVTRSERTLTDQKRLEEGEQQALACLTCRDVTEEREATERLAYLARYDAVTGLLNRNGFEYFVGEMLTEAREDGRQLCVVQFSLSNLDQIIASLGFSYGDRVRQAIAARLKSHLGQDAVWSNLTASVFAGAVSVIRNVDQEKVFIDDVEHVIAEDYMVDGARISVRLDFGYILDTGAYDVDQLLKKSGNALARARRNDRVSVLPFHPDMDEALERRRLLETELFKAIVRDELRMVYQPIVSLEDSSVIGAEALLRWTHREIGEISPGEFIPVAEENGYIVELGAWVLNRAMKEAVSWSKPIRLAANMSALQFSRGDIVATVQEALERSGFPAERLDIEITESLFIDDSIDLKGTMERLKAIGCRFSLDDFGTGYASLGYIPKYPFSKLKVDRIFVMDVVDNKQDQMLIKSVLQMAHAFDMDVVFEGIETIEHKETLEAIGCKIGQGYLYGRPMSAADLALLV